MPSPVQEQAGENSIPFCPLTPTEHQKKFVESRARGVIYAAGQGGGKTVAILMAALRDMNKYGHRALIVSHGGHAFDVMTDWVKGYEGVKVSPYAQSITFPRGGVVVFHEPGADLIPRIRSMDLSFAGVDTYHLPEEEVINWLKIRLRKPPHELKESHPLNMDDGWTEVWESWDR